MAKKRIKTPTDIENRLLADNRHTCCICQLRQDVQIHHIDENPSNNNPKNLFVACVGCHSQVHSNQGFGRKYSPGELEIYKEQWEDRCKLETTKGSVIKQTFIFIADHSMSDDPKLLRGIVANLSSGVTMPQVIGHVDLSANLLAQSSGSITMADEYRSFVMDKNTRQEFEIKEFIKSYRRLHGREFVIISKQDKPDYIVQDTNSNERFGIELTSVYLDDRSVPDVHMVDGIMEIPDDPEQKKAYENRIIAAVTDKVHKAKKGYDTSFPLILSVYVNEYISLHMGKEYWQSFAERNDTIFDSIDPFVEVVFWPLPNRLVVSARKTKNDSS